MHVHNVRRGCGARGRGNRGGRGDRGREEVVLVVEAGDDEGIVIQDLAIIRIDDHDDEINNSF
ncbi:hypothetical protein YC2023_089342 [Brassica napus]